MTQEGPGTDPPRGSAVVSGIGQLVTNDPDREGLLGIVQDAAVVVQDGLVAWVGHAADLPTDYSGVEVLDVGGRAVVPGFVDAHTHAVFAGDRSREFEMRMGGATYTEILESGGGIYSTVEATRASSFVDLIAASLPRFQRMLAAGTTTVEVKSGYGLDIGTEVGMIAATKAIDMAVPMDLVPTFLGAHVVAPEFRDDRDAYVDIVAGPMLDAVASEVSFVDVFCDDAAFGIEETLRIADAAGAHGLPVRLHTDQLSRNGATALAASISAASADHLDHATDEDLEALRVAGTAAVLLPGVSYSMRERPPDARRVWDAGVTVALATDCNPGTSYIETMPFIISLAVVTGGLAPDEALWAATKGSAESLLLGDRGDLTAGALADLVVIDAPRHEHIAYRPDGSIVAAVMKRGQLVFSLLQ